MIHPERRQENLKKIEEMDKRDAEPLQPDWKTWCMNKKVDMVEVVRCKDCRHFQMHEWSDFHKRIWPKDGDRWYECLHPDDDGEHGTRTRGPDWFCADGERRAE